MFMRWLERQLALDVQEQGLDSEGLVASFRQIQEAAKSQLPKDINTPLMIERAHELGIPWRHRVGNYFQYGWGRNSRMFDSTFTDQTRVLGVRLARDKWTCHRLLGDMGLPVTKMKRVSTLDEAKQVTLLFGFPVVLKPVNLDGGLGVHVGIFDDAGLEQAFESARKLSPSLLVERYVEGVDCRLQVLNGEVFWGVMRRPACVVGDGKSSVNVLIELSNQERLKEATLVGVDLTQERSPKPIVLADETLAWLARQGLDFEAVPAVGQEVRLRGAANVSLGGSFKPVLNEVHPDNIALAKRVGQVLGLDLYGVDLLIPDFRRSWKEQACAICEVNAQPEISRGAHEHLMTKLLPHQGRIPVFMSLNHGLNAFWLRLKSFLETKKMNLGHATPDKTLFGSVPMSGFGYFKNVHMLLSDTQTDVLALSLPSSFLSHESWPVDQVDVLIMLDAQANALTKLQISLLLDRVKEIWVCADVVTPSDWMKEHPGFWRQVSERRLGLEIVNKVNKFYRESVG
jgi:cyanophycin synthetase